MEILKYELKEPFDIHEKGELVQAKFIEINGPSNLVLRHVSVLDAEMNKAIFKFARMEKEKTSSRVEESENESTEKHELSGSDILMALNGSGGDVGKCYDSLKSILKLSCFVNANVQFTGSMFDKMSYIDTKEILGEYLKFFLASSLRS